MKRWWVLFLLAAVSAVPAVRAQDTARALESYQNRFRDAVPEVKLQILQTADLLHY